MALRNLQPCTWGRGGGYGRICGHRRFAKTRDAAGIYIPADSAEAATAPETCESQAYNATVIRALVLRISQEEQVDPGLAEAIAKVESGMGKNLASKAGALGVMQLMPATGIAYGATNRCDAEANIRAGLRYLYDLIGEFKDPILALAAYNAGPSKVYRHRGVPNSGRDGRLYREGPQSLARL